MTLFMNQSLHNFNKRICRKILRIQGNLINHFAAAISSNKTSEAEIAHRVFTALEGDQAVGKFAVKQPLIVEIKRLL
ncbi:hypothetical protein SDC9_173266 [bioreactor metagenome]|uniref:Uncharacterized protein n=1 Tax=bioreactor metagenome TaxID=1076179 RepID=A0A645GJ57_9ZZZZ